MSIDDMESPEWSLTALGPQKRGLAANPDQASEAAVRTRRSAPLRTRQVVSRRIAAALDVRLLVAARRPADLERRRAHRRRDRRLRARTRRTRGTSSWSSPACWASTRSMAISAYEDVWHYLWRERRLPVNVDPLQSEAREQRGARAARGDLRRSARPGGRVRVAAASGSTNPTGRAQWESGVWFFRSGHLFLTPGDSPIGYRLPLDSLPWVAPEEYPHLSRPTRWHRRRRCRRASSTCAPPREPCGREPRSRPRRRRQSGESAAGVVRTALCVEARHGRLHVFMPPVSSAEDYLDLVAAIEADGVER